MKGQISIEIMISIFLSLALVLSICIASAKIGGLYDYEMILGGTYAGIANQSVSGMEAICGCYPSR